MKPKSIAVYITDPTRPQTDAHCSIKSDAVIRMERTPGTLAATLVIDVEGDHEYKISDAQCQSAISLVLASQLNYKIDSGNIRCYGITWDELLRRG